ncbi:sugar O-acetyltransferase [Bifidobacterium pseudolongum]|uniref:Acetyltransferase n=2 Tax=Bifidobacterium pseudolongum TaxID=1694 RepID=A0A0A7IBF6_9BIFI|nr:sugar O-acetyltransferase [Bifidobacterium pseudolongum]AIZ16540.1 galactoside O-acetyltransferase [Bifidobacterium pseudolongum PV8-2]MCH4835485.1 sugar O-acetyltransferase [Bifidobacterium pseudolongum]
MNEHSTREYERMVSGELYIADDPHLHALGAKRRRLQHEINTSAWDAFDERTALFRELFGAIGEGSHIEPPFRCDYGCNITIGHGFYANTDCIILDVAPVTIGDNVFFGPRVGLYTPYHPIDAQTRNAQLEGGRPIRIGNDVWFGANVTVCPGVTIGNDVVIGAGSVVTKDIPDHSVAVGNPARVIRAIDDAERDRWRAKAAEYCAWKGM